MAKLTKWHDGRKTVPGQKGVFKRKFPINGREAYSYWDGKYWRAYCSTPYSAKCNKHIKSNVQYAEWRGLASDPKAKP
jgi:hypothetical protein